MWQGHRGFFTNICYPLVRPSDWTAVLSQATAIVPAGVPVSLVSATAVPDLGPDQWALVGHPPLMARPAGPIEDAPPEELTIRAVTDAAGVEEFERTLVHAYPDTEMQPYRMGDLYDERILGDRTRLFVACVGPWPVGTASSHVAAGVNVIEMVSVAPSFRGRGYGAALTAAAIGVETSVPAVLLASDLGRPTYERLGFAEVERWTFWHRPRTARQR